MHTVYGCNTDVYYNVYIQYAPKCIAIRVHSYPFYYQYYNINMVCTCTSCPIDVLVECSEQAQQRGMCACVYSLRAMRNNSYTYLELRRTLWYGDIEINMRI